MKPRLLDLFCCAGGAGTGYARAGFDVVGVDIDPQPRYPYKFHQADALEFLASHGHEFDAIHASPPCQVYSVTRHAHSAPHPDFLESTRVLLSTLSVPYVIENVPGAPLLAPLQLCGSEFGLKAADVDGVQLALRRHRLFESSVWLMGAGGCIHDDTLVGGSYKGVHAKYRRPEGRDEPSRKGGYTPAVHVRGALMEIDWMNEHELAQAIPPAYTEFIGRQLIEALEVAA
jgi:DNA (cytosine-5)-methyltransferase 1